MKKKIFLLPCIAAVAIATFVGAKSFQTNAYESSSLLMQNVEALSKNESDGTSDCKGLLGKCSFKCSKCGYDYWAIGATFVNNHKCTQK